VPLGVHAGVHTQYRQTVKRGGGEGGGGGPAGAAPLERASTAGTLSAATVLRVRGGRGAGLGDAPSGIYGVGYWAQN